LAEALFSGFSSGRVLRGRQFIGGDAMDCDQVFMVLTRGPFPTGEAWDEDVEAHLESCADCWRLAEALRPALEVFQEAVPPAESRELPGYWGDARPAAAVVSDLSRASVRVALASRARRFARSYPAYHQYPLTNPASSELLRVVVFSSAVAAAAICAAIIWWIW
jgi:hypothetical protein